MNETYYYFRDEFDGAEYLFKNQKELSIFLAGTIDNDNSYDWQNDVIKAFERGLRIVRVEDDSANEVYYEVGTEDEIFDNFDTEQEAVHTAPLSLLSFGK